MQRKPASAWTRGPYRKAGKKPTAPPPTPPLAAATPPRTTTAGELASLRPRERLDAIHAMQALLDLKVRQGQLVERAEVEAAHAEMREVIRGDLLGTLPLRVAGMLAGHTPTAAEVREAVLRGVREVLDGWRKAAIPVPESGGQ